MESELSGIFRVKLVTKNIERGSPGSQFMHMRVNTGYITNKGKQVVKWRQTCYLNCHVDRMWSICVGIGSHNHYLFMHQVGFFEIIFNRVNLQSFTR